MQQYHVVFGYFQRAWAADNRFWVHNNLVASQGDQGGVGSGLFGNVCHGADLAGIKAEQKIRQCDSVGRRPARTFDPQADEIYVVQAGLIFDHFLHLPDLVGGDRSLQVDPHRLPGIFQGRIVLDRQRRQVQCLDKFAAVGCQISDKTQIAGFFAGQLQGFAGRLEDFRGRGGLRFFQLFETLGRYVFGADLGLDGEDFQGGIQ